MTLLQCVCPALAFGANSLQKATFAEKTPYMVARSPRQTKGSTSSKSSAFCSVFAPSATKMQETRNKMPATLEQRSGNGYNAVMSKKAKSEKTHHHPLLECFSPDALAEAEEFLARIDERRQAYEPDSVELSPLRQSLIARIKAAFSGVTCYREPRMLLGGEAEDDYLSPDAQALLTPLEERDDWEDIPDDLLHACSCALSYVGPHAYRFLIPPLHGGGFA